MTTMHERISNNSSIMSEGDERQPIVQRDKKPKYRDFLVQHFMGFFFYPLAVCFHGMVIFRHQAFLFGFASDLK